MNVGNVKLYICFTIGKTKYAFYEMVDLTADQCNEVHVLSEIWRYIRCKGINVRYNCSITDIIWNDGTNGNANYKYLRDGNDFEFIDDEKLRELKFNQYTQEITDSVEFKD